MTTCHSRLHVMQSFSCPTADLNRKAQDGAQKGPEMAIIKHPGAYVAVFGVGVLLCAGTADAVSPLAERVDAVEATVVDHEARIVALEAADPGPDAKGPQIYDSNGVQVGQLVGFSGSSAWAMLDLELGPFVVYVRDTGVDRDGPIFFDGPGCTGAAFFSDSANYRMPSAGLVTPHVIGGDRVLWVRAGADIPSPAYQSFRDHKGTCYAGDGGYSYQGTSTPIDPLYDLGSMFSAPFTLR